MKMYSRFGTNEPVICLDFKGEMIKEFFADFSLHTSNVTFDIARNRMEVHQNSSKAWRGTLIDTGSETMTGDQLRRIRPYVADEQAFCMIYAIADRISILSS